MKVIVDAETKILGAAILGTSGDEAIHGLLDTAAAGELHTTLQRARIHPRCRNFPRCSVIWLR
jgi:pyruvate/2-oxoglutarate dehydrogenase complex dihydrolipoamide dehydrogenase (E3) component